MSETVSASVDGSRRS